MKISDFLFDSVKGWRILFYKRANLSLFFTTAWTWMSFSRTTLNLGQLNYCKDNLLNYKCHILMHYNTWQPVSGGRGRGCTTTQIYLSRSPISCGLSLHLKFELVGNKLQRALNAINFINVSCKNLFLSPVPYHSQNKHAEYLCSRSLTSQHQEIKSSISVSCTWCFHMLIQGSLW